MKSGAVNIMILYYIATDEKEFNVITLPCHKETKKIKNKTKNRKNKYRQP